MRAVLCSAFTGREAPRIGEIEASKPASDEILIDVYAASVSFMDLASHLGLRVIADQVEWAKAAGVKGT